MSGRLAENVALFGRVLRGAGLPVGPGSVLDAVAAVEAAGLRRRDDLRAALRCVFVTRREQSEVFDAAFRLFWRRRGLLDRSLSDPPPAPAGSADPDAPEPAPAETRVNDAVRPERDEPREAPEPREVAARLQTSAADVLKGRDFAQMSAAEIARAKRLIAGLVLPDDARRTRRFEPDPRGRSIDGRRTLRGSLRGGGGTIELARRSHREIPPPVVALVDISGSMAEYSRLFLHFLHALTEGRRRVHSFVFATRLTNVTRELAHRDPDDALARAAARVRDWEGGTRIASALRAFNRDWSRRVLAGGATVLLFTDGLERDVGPDLAFEADRLHRSCRRLVWLNPLLRFDAFEPRAAGVRALLPHVDAFRPIHSLASMESLVRALGEERNGRDRPARAAGGDVRQNARAASPAALS